MPHRSSLLFALGLICPAAAQTTLPPDASAIVIAFNAERTKVLTKLAPTLNTAGSKIVAALIIEGKGDETKSIGTQLIDKGMGKPVSSPHPAIEKLFAQFDDAVKNALSGARQRYAGQLDGLVRTRRGRLAPDVIEAIELARDGILGLKRKLPDGLVRNPSDTGWFWQQGGKGGHEFFADGTLTNTTRTPKVLGTWKPQADGTLLCEGAVGGQRYMHLDSHKMILCWRDVSEGPKALFHVIFVHRIADISGADLVSPSQWVRPEPSELDPAKIDPINPVNTAWYRERDGKRLNTYRFHPSGRFSIIEPAGHEFTGGHWNSESDGSISFEIPRIGRHRVKLDPITRRMTYEHINGRPDEPDEIATKITAHISNTVPCPKPWDATGTRWIMVSTAGRPGWEYDFLPGGVLHKIDYKSGQVAAGSWQMKSDHTIYSDIFGEGRFEIVLDPEKNWLFYRHVESGVNGWTHHRQVACVTDFSGKLLSPFDQTPPDFQRPEIKEPLPSEPVALVSPAEITKIWSIRSSSGWHGTYEIKAANNELVITESAGHPFTSKWHILDGGIIETNEKSRSGKTTQFRLLKDGKLLGTSCFGSTLYGSVLGSDGTLAIPEEPKLAHDDAKLIAAAASHRATPSGIDGAGTLSRDPNGSYPILIASITAREVTLLHASDIREWSTAVAITVGGKAAWKIDMLARVQTAIGPQDTDIHAIVIGDRVAGWFFSGSGEDIP